MSWFVYNKMLLPDSPPHKNPDLTNLHNKLKLNKVYLARYITDFDCGHETNWWYLIKDCKTDLLDIKSKYRGEVNKGLKNTIVKIIDREQYKDEMFQIFKTVISNRPQHKREDLNLFFERTLVPNKVHLDVWGVFIKNLDILAAYAIVEVFEDHVKYREFYFNSFYHKYFISNALVFNLNYYYLNVLKKKYVSDGERSINHPSNIQDYLIRTFGFRKAYCKLHIVYKNKLIHLFVNILYIFKPIIYIFKDFSVFNRNLYSIIKQEEIHKSFNK